MGIFMAKANSWAETSKIIVVGFNLNYFTDYLPFQYSLLFIYLYTCTGNQQCKNVHVWSMDRNCIGRNGYGPK